MAMLAFSVSDQDRADIEALAYQLGFSSVEVYLGALVKAQILQQSDPQDLSVYTADVLLVMPADQRKVIQMQMAALAEAEYRDNPDLVAFNTEEDFYDYPDSD
jgi:hypothetical protein